MLAVDIHATYIGCMNCLSQYLADNKIRQEDFAAAIGVAQSVVSRLCNGKSQPSPELASKIQKVTSGQVPYFAWKAFESFGPEAAE